MKNKIDRIMLFMLYIKMGWLFLWNEFFGFFLCLINKDIKLRYIKLEWKLNYLIFYLKEIKNMISWNWIYLLVIFIGILL